MKNQVEDPECRAFDLQFIIQEIDVLAEELAKLEPSMDRTASELRLAQMRQLVELVHNRQGQEVESQAAANGA